eukprot:6479791-Amphidinium_carterae.1
MRRTSLQRMCEVIQFKKRLDTAVGKSHTATDIAAQYAERVRLDSSSEAVSETFVEQSVRLWKHFFSVDSINKLLFSTDNDTRGSKNPLDSLMKLDTIHRRVRGETQVLWVLRSLLDLTRATGNEIPTRDLDGKGQGWQGQSLVEVMLRKKAIREHLVEAMGKYSWTAELKDIDCRFSYS